MVPSPAILVKSPIASAIQSKARGNFGSRFDRLTNDLAEKGIKGQSINGMPSIKAQEIGERVNGDKKGQKKAILCYPPTFSNLNKENIPLRKPLTPISQNKNSLDPPKHSVSPIYDDQIHFSPPCPLENSTQLSFKPTKESLLAQPHGPDKRKSKGIQLAKNLHKTIKVRQTKNSSSTAHSNQVKEAILESLHNARERLTLAPIVE